MSNNILSRYRRGGIITIVFLLINLLLVTHASADLFRVTYGVTFQDEEIIIPPGTTDVFGVTEGPVDVTGSFLIDTSIPWNFIEAGSFTPAGTKASNDFYGYTVPSISDLSCTFGSKTWDTDDIAVHPDIGGSIGVAFDSLLTDGSTPRMHLFLSDVEGHIIFDAFGGISNPPEMFIFTNSPPFSEVSQFELFAPLFHQGLYDVSVQATTPVPEPTTMLLLGSGLIGLLGLRRKFKK